MKSFDLEAAKAGAPVVTRDGRPVRIICFDKKDNGYPIVALITGVGETEAVFTFNLDGRNQRGHEVPIDLFMAPVKKKAWVNIYKTVYGTTHHYTHFTEESAEYEKSVRSTGTELKFLTQITYEWEE